MSHHPSCNGNCNRPPARKGQEWRDHLPTRQPKATMGDRQASWLQWLLPPSELHDFLLWPIPKIALPGLALSAAHLAAVWWGDAVGVGVLAIFGLLVGLFTFVAMSAARGNEALGTLTFLLMTFGTVSAMLFVLAREVCYAFL